MTKKKLLFICGSLNQTTMMHRVSEHLSGYDCFFTPYYSSGFINVLSKTGLLNFSILGGSFRKRTLDYLKKHNLRIDAEGKNNNYDLVFTCSDLIVPENIKDKKIILVQEGMTDPENFAYTLVKKFNFPRWIASTSTTGLSDAYVKFCVASEGYKDFFARKGVKREKIVATGIPNFDNCLQYTGNSFPFHNYVLVATSDSRETFKYENRKKLILNAVKLAAGRQLIFKLHPNEKVDRATAEINLYAPGALVFADGNTNYMIANCDVLVTRFSSVVYVGLALGKEVYSEFDLEELKRLQPIQNGGRSAYNISLIAKEILEKGEKIKPADTFIKKRKIKKIVPGAIRLAIPVISFFRFK